MITDRLRIIAALPVMAVANVLGIAGMVLTDCDDILEGVAHAIIGGEDV